MQTRQLIQHIQKLLERKDNGKVVDLYAAFHPAEVAEALAEFQPPQIWEALSRIPEEKRAEIFSHLEDDLQVEVAVSLGRGQLARLLTHMSPDDRVDLFKKIPEEQADAILPAMAQLERDELRRLAAYPEGSAGSIMTSEYAVLQAELTVEQAIAKLRREAPDKETIYYAFIVDAERRLIGLVSLKDLILSRPGLTVGQLMHREVIFARVLEDQEEAARKISKYDLLALPVVNEEDVLVGIVTYDDALDVLNQEHTEDMEKFMAITGRHEDVPYLRTSVWTHFRNRVIWIILLAALGMVSGLVIRRFESTLMNLLILAMFMPMLADTGGNTGGQSATVVIRSLALRQVSGADTFKILWKELRISVLLSIVLGAMTFGRVLLFAGGETLPPGNPLLLVGAAIALALSLQVVSATLIGAALPMVASLFRLDPAVMASPALTTFVDITGLLIYFTTVRLVLGM